MANLGFKSAYFKTFIQGCVQQNCSVFQLPKTNSYGVDKYYYLSPFLFIYFAVMNHKFKVYH